MDYSFSTRAYHYTSIHFINGFISAMKDLQEGKCNLFIYRKKYISYFINEYEAGIQFILDKGQSGKSRLKPTHFGLLEIYKDYRGQKDFVHPEIKYM